MSKETLLPDEMSLAESIALQAIAHVNEEYTNTPLAPELKVYKAAQEAAKIALELTTTLDLRTNEGEA